MIMIPSQILVSPTSSAQVRPTLRQRCLHRRILCPPLRGPICILLMSQLVLTRLVQISLFFYVIAGPFASCITRSMYVQENIETLRHWLAVAIADEKVICIASFQSCLLIQIDGHQTHCLIIPRPLGMNYCDKKLVHVERANTWLLGARCACLSSTTHFYLLPSAIPCSQGLCSAHHHFLRASAQKINQAAFRSAHDFKVWGQYIS